MVVHIAVVYHSISGHTDSLAKALIKGIESTPGVTVHPIRITGEEVTNGRFVDPDKRLQLLLESCDGMAFGSPTLMGSVSCVLKAFIEWTFQTAWMSQSWKDKWATGFTNSASQSGDKLNTLIDLVIFAAQMAMVWVPQCEPPGNNLSTKSIQDINRLGSWLGVMGQSNGDQGPDLAPPPSDCLTAEMHGGEVCQNGTALEERGGIRHREEAGRLNSSTLSCWEVRAMSLVRKVVGGKGSRRVLAAQVELSSRGLRESESV